FASCTVLRRFGCRSFGRERWLESGKRTGSPGKRGYAYKGEEHLGWTGQLYQLSRLGRERGGSGAKSRRCKFARDRLGYEPNRRSHPLRASRYGYAVLRCGG